MFLKIIKRKNAHSIRAGKVKLYDNNLYIEVFLLFLMTFERYGCGICKHIYSDKTKAEECERQGRFPALPEGRVFINEGDGTRTMTGKDIILVSGEKLRINEETHDNVYRTAVLMKSSPTDFYTFADHTLEGNSNLKEIENPRETLKNHPLFGALEVVLNKGVYDGLIELTGEGEDGTIARFKDMSKREQSGEIPRCYPF
jgi:hypothetical protein